MTKEQIKETINTNTELIQKALNRDLDIMTMNILIKGISLHNEKLIEKLNSL